MPETKVDEEPIPVAEYEPAVKKRWFWYKGRKVGGYVLAVDEDEVAELAGLPRNKLKIKEAEWNGEEFVIKRQSDEKEGKKEKEK